MIPRMEGLESELENSLKVSVSEFTTSTVTFFRK